MQRAIVIVLLFLSFGLKAQVYQAMPQAGYGPVKRFLTDSVLTIPTGINSLRNITGGRDAGQIRWNTTDSGFYVYSGYQWIKINIDSVSLSNRINGKLSISDTATMLSAYMRKTDTLSLSNRINLRVKYTDTASMLSVYLRKLDTASLSDRINTKQDPITLTTTGISGVSTFISNTLNIPNYGGALTAYVPYSGATTDVTLGARNLTGTLINADYALQVKNGLFGGASNGYTSLTSYNEGFSFFTNYMSGPTTFTKGASFLYPTSGTTYQYYLPIRNGTLALVEDTVSLSNRINAKIGASDTVSLSNRINLKVNISDTASMLLPYLRKGDTSSLSNRIDLKLNAADTASLSNRINLKLNISDTASMLSSYQSAINARVKYSDTAAMLDPYLTAAVTSVGLSMPVAFSVANSPITSTGTLAVSAIGTAAQYIRGDGQLATLPSGASGGSSVNYYLNGSVNQGTIGGSVYYEMNKTSVIGAGTDFALAGNGLISQFITDVADPNRLEIPAGNWNFEIYMSASSSGGSPEFYVELLKYDGTNFTSIASSSANPEAITGGTTIDLYLTALAIPQTTLLATDRLAIRVYIVNSTGGRTITMHTENSHLCEIITTFAGGVSSLNGLTANTQYLAVDTAGTDFAINSLVDTHTFNLPTASATNRGALSSADWSTFNGKMNYTDTVSLSNRINTKLNSSDTVSLSNRINTKADALSGTTNTVPKFTSSTTIGNSNIKDDGNAVSINTTAGANGALQVGDYNGGIMINKSTSGASLIFKNTLSSDKLWDINPVGNDLSIDESNIGAPRMFFQAGGNVGISTITPTKTLEVNGTFKASDTATFNKLSNGTYTYTLPSGTGTLALTSAFDTTSLSNRINLKLNISDTASMLSGYQSAINSKQAAITLTTTGTSGAATFSSNTLNIPQYQAAGTYVTSVTGTSPIVSSGGTTPAISIPAATSSVNGYLSSTDWTTFNGKESALTFSSPLVRTVNAISIPAATTSVNGYLSATDWTTFNNKVSTATLSGYLPLTGGTLTGALGGTSATFYIGDDIIGTYFLGGSGNTARQLKFSTSTTTNVGDTHTIDAQSGTGVLQFATTSSVKMTLNTSGNVGIGTTSPTGKLHSYIGDITAGNAPASSGTTPVNAMLNLTNNRGIGMFFGGSYAGNYGQWIQVSDVGNLSVNYPLYLNPNGGNVLMGTTTDNGSKLQVTGAATFSSSVTAGGAITTSTSVANVALDITNTDTVNGFGAYIQGGGTAANRYSLRVKNGAGTTVFDVLATGAATFSSSVTATDAIDIKGVGSNTLGSGPFLQMGSSAGNRYFLEQLNASDGCDFWYYNGSSWSVKQTFNSDGNVKFIGLAGTGSRAVLADANGLLSAPVSDSSVKENIKPLDYGIADIMKLKPVSFEYIKSYKNYGEGKQIGNIAQDMAKVIPEAVFTTPSTGKMGINYDQLNGVYIKALQELQEQINILKSEIQTLKNK